MNRRIPGGRPLAWQDAGRQIAPLLGSYHAAVVTSSDPVAAGHVALGIAQAEVGQRRVVVGDLVGDLPALRSLVKDDDPHGISDSFLYGVSLNKIEAPVEDVENLFVMPSGTEPGLGEVVFRSARWKRLAGAFTENGDLLLLVARRDTPGIAELIEQVDGAVLVKDTELPTAPTALILARVETPTPTLKLPLFRRVGAASRWPRKKWLYPGIAALIVLIAGGAGLSVMGNRTAFLEDLRTRAAARKTSPPVVTPSAQPAVAIVAPPVNPVDSPNASAFGVLMVVANTQEGANFVVRRDSLLPSVTVAPVPIGPERTTWYRVIAGAYTRRYQADSLLSVLRRSRILPTDSMEHVLHAPLALLVDSVATQGGIGDAVKAAVAKYAARGLTVYGLIQDDGGAFLYTGAFENAEQSAELTRTLKGAGLNPLLVYRTGRTP